MMLSRALVTGGTAKAFLRTLAGATFAQKSTLDLHSQTRMYVNNTVSLRDLNRYSGHLEIF